MDQPEEHRGQEKEKGLKSWLVVDGECWAGEKHDLCCLTFWELRVSKGARK
jgi:hypothetical protein